MANPNGSATISEAREPMDIVRLVAHFALHPEQDLHASWLPVGLPVSRRSKWVLGEGARSMLSDLLRAELAAVGAPMDFNFDSRLKRLVLIDARALRRLAAYVGFSLHLPLLRSRGRVGAQLRRQARRFDADAVEFLLDRTPQPVGLRMDGTAFEQRPAAAGRIVVERGYRILIATVALEGPLLLRRVQYKLPRRLSFLKVPVIEPSQSRQLQELMLSCIVPERLPQWDWLF